MTTMHIRHMPVMEDGRLIGIISHRDVIRALHRKSEIEFRSSCDYLGGTYGLRVY
jgi:CBS domain-containing protein